MKATKKWLWLVCLALVVLLGTTSAASGAEAEKNTREAQMSYVFVIDSTGEKDFNLAAITVCEMMADIHPGGDVQIGVISYGYVDEETEYDHQYYVKPGMEAYLVHQIAALEPVDAAFREEIRQALEHAFGIKGMLSPHGQGLLAGVDMLQAAGVPDGKGCIIMISDGIKATNDVFGEGDGRNKAVEAARKRGWPIYTLELTDKKPEENGHKSMMQQISADAMPHMQTAGNDTFGHWWIDGSSGGVEIPREQALTLEILQAVQRILDGNAQNMEPENGSITVPVTVPSLTGEYVMVFSGAGLEDVTVEPENEHVQIIGGKNYFVVRIPTYISREWVLKASTRDEKSIFVSRKIARADSLELQILDNTGNKIMGSSEGSGKELDPNEMVCFQVVCSCDGRVLKFPQDDQSVSAVLQIRCGEFWEELLDERTLKPDDEGAISVNLKPESLAEMEYRKYEKKTGSYRARVIVYDGETELCRSGWVEFCVKQCRFIQKVKEEQEYECKAGQTVEIPVGDFVDYDGTHPLIYTLIQDEYGEANFSIVDEAGNECSEYSTLSGTLQIKNITKRVGIYKECLKISTGNQEYEFKLKIEVPTEKKGDVTDSITVKDLETLPMPEDVVDVVVLENSDPEVVSVSYDEDENKVMIRREKTGSTILTLELKHDSLEMDESGAFVNQTSKRTYEIEVPFRWDLAVIILVAAGAVIVWALVFFIKKRKERNAVRIDKPLIFQFVLIKDGKNYEFPVREQGISVNHLRDSVTIASHVQDYMEAMLAKDTPFGVKSGIKNEFNACVGTLNQKLPDWFGEIKIGGCKENQDFYELRAGWEAWPDNTVVLLNEHGRETKKIAEQRKIGPGETLVITIVEKKLILKIKLMK